MAIKVLRAELDAPADLARFRRERRLLSTLDHPHIARLLDAGVTPGGRPFLVLEYIDGDPLLAYCDAHALDITRRLQLFLGVADGVDAAHRRLILHRDIKPSNVMVGRDGRVRLLDFGVSTLLEGGDDEGATTRSHWLTPEYASPEQLQGAPLTSASDVYQLGALLYELLSGTRAFVRRSGSAGDGGSTGASGRSGPAVASPRCAARRPRRDRPQGDAHGQATIATRRCATSQPTCGGIWPTSRCYARAGDRWYRVAAMDDAACDRTRRHGGPSARDRSVSVATLAASRRRIAKALASETLERTKAKEVTGFLLALFRANDPLQPASDTVSARTLLQRGLSRLDSLSGQPEVQAALLQVIGQIQDDLGAVDSARSNLARALALRRQLHTFDDRTHAETCSPTSAASTFERGTSRTAEAELRQSLAVFRGGAATRPSVAISAQYDLAVAYHQQRAKPQSRQAFDAGSAAPRPTPRLAVSRMPSGSTR